MIKLCTSLMVFSMILASSANAQEQCQSDIIRTSSGDLTITCVGQRT